METKKISQTTAAKKGYYFFGGKGDVWNNTAHLSKSGMTTTLCGKPMLSTNWVQIEGIEEIGCLACSKIFLATPL